MSHIVCISKFKEGDYESLEQLLKPLGQANHMWHDSI